MDLENSHLTSLGLHAVFKVNLVIIAGATWSQMYLGLLRQSCVQLGAKIYSRCTVMERHLSATNTMHWYY